jgi:hypothetical protein
MGLFSSPTGGGAGGLILSCYSRKPRNGGLNNSEERESERNPCLFRHLQHNVVPPPVAVPPRKVGADPGVRLNEHVDGAMHARDVCQVGGHRQGEGGRRRNERVAHLKAARAAQYIGQRNEGTCPTAQVKHASPRSRMTPSRRRYGRGSMQRAAGRTVERMEERRVAETCGCGKRATLRGC